MFHVIVGVDFEVVSNGMYKFRVEIIMKSIGIVKLGVSSWSAIGQVGLCECVEFR